MQRPFLQVKDGQLFIGMVNRKNKILKEESLGKGKIAFEILNSKWRKLEIEAKLNNQGRGGNQ